MIIYDAYNPYTSWLKMIVILIKIMAPKCVVWLMRRRSLDFDHMSWLGHAVHESRVLIAKDTWRLLSL